MSGPRVIKTDGVPIKAWTEGVPLQPEAEGQLRNIASLPFIHKQVVAMPDVHWGQGAAVGCVIPTRGAIIPAAVGVDIGCGMMAVETSLTSHHLPDDLAGLRSAIEKAVPHGRTGNKPASDRGAWGDIPDDVAVAWTTGTHRRRPLGQALEEIVARHPAIASANSLVHLGTLGSGNHFIEVCLDEADRVWVMLHSGSRGIGNRIGSHFIALARDEMKRWFIALPDADLAYLAEGSQHFDDYVDAVGWAQDFARANREVMMERVLGVLRHRFRDFDLGHTMVDCHHNYVAREKHFGARVWVARKGALSAAAGEPGIIPGSMGAKSFIVRGRGEKAALASCSHGAGRAMSRTEAKKRFTVADHVRATRGVECRKDAAVVDETPGAYKDIDAVMAAQADLVDVVHTLKQVLCVKG